MTREFDPTKPVRRLYGWVNFYGPHFWTAHESRHLADKWAADHEITYGKRTECLEIVHEYEEGEGL